MKANSEKNTSLCIIALLVFFSFNTLCFPTLTDATTGNAIGTNGGGEQEQNFQAITEEYHPEVVDVRKEFLKVILYS